VILLTARAATGDAVEGLKCGADDVVTKPFDARELRQRIDNHLTVRDLLRERYERHVRLDGTEARVSEDDVPFLKQIMVAIENHLDDPDFTVARLSEAVALSRRHLSRRLKAAVGETGSEFVRRYRIERAAELLDDDPETIAEVAYAVGFRSPSHFTQVFRERVGCTPSEYVKGNA
jgi:AraC-like DNA-binding protein